MDIQCVCKYVGKRRNIYFLIRRRTDTQTHISIHIVGIGSYTKTSTKTGHENMRNQKLTRDCRRARYAQGSPKAGPRATFGQKNLEQPPYICICIYIYIYTHIIWVSNSNPNISQWNHHDKVAASNTAGESRSQLCASMDKTWPQVVAWWGRCWGRWILHIAIIMLELWP